MNAVRLIRLIISFAAVGFLINELLKPKIAKADFTEQARVTQLNPLSQFITVKGLTNWLKDYNVRCSVKEGDLILTQELRVRDEDTGKTYFVCLENIK